MNFDVDALLEVMKEYGDSISSLAVALGKSRQNISQVFNGQHDFTFPQVRFIVERYSLSPDQVFRIFFTKKEGGVSPLKPPPVRHHITVLGSQQANK